MDRVSRPKKKTRGVSHCRLAIYIKKYLKAKDEELRKLKFSPCKNIIFKKSSKSNQVLTQAKIGIIFQKSSYKNK
jgi:hypothetical protein